MRLFSSWFVVAPLMLLLSLRAASAPQAPSRIVSINLCFDELLLKLVEPERIQALYYLSANAQFSSISEQATHFNLHHGLAEEIVPLKPDLILAGEYSSPDLMVLLKQLGVRVEVLALPRRLNEVSTHIRRLGELTQSQAAAEVMAVQLEQQLQRLAAPLQTAPIPAFWYSSNGVVVGGDTLENELMTRAGFHNLALDKHISGFKQIDLEALMLAQPRALIVEYSDVQAFSLAKEYVQHPALRSKSIDIIRLSTTLSCIAPVAAQTIGELMHYHQQLLAKPLERE